MRKLREGGVGAISSHQRKIEINKPEERERERNGKVSK